MIVASVIRNSLLNQKKARFGWSIEDWISEMSEALDRILRASHRVMFVAFVTMVGLSRSLAADVDQGKAIAERWCTECHIVKSEQKSPVTDQAPSFASIARTPDFGSQKLAILLLQPHPNMPKLALSQAEIANLADYIATLK